MPSFCFLRHRPCRVGAAYSLKGPGRFEPIGASQGLLHSDKTHDTSASVSGGYSGLGDFGSFGSLKSWPEPLTNCSSQISLHIDFAYSQAEKCAP